MVCIKFDDPELKLKRAPILSESGFNSEASGLSDAPPVLPGVTSSFTHPRVLCFPRYMTQQQRSSMRTGQPLRGGKAAPTLGPSPTLAVTLGGRSDAV